MIVIADTTPLNYLLLIGHIDLLPLLFGRVVIPQAVAKELRSTAAPIAVQEWMTSLPGWIEIRSTAGVPDQGLLQLDDGEREAIQLAEELAADLLLVDEKAARREAARRLLPTSGTLGILDRAADKGYLDFRIALEKLKRTSFFISPAVEQFFLLRDAQRKNDGRV